MSHVQVPSPEPTRAAAQAAASSVDPAERVDPRASRWAAALYAALVSLEVACAAIMVLERRTGRVRWPMPTMLGYYLVMHVTMTPIARSETFQQFSNWFGMVGRADR